MSNYVIAKSITINTSIDLSQEITVWGETPKHFLEYTYPDLYKRITNFDIDASIFFKADTKLEEYENSYIRGECDLYLVGIPKIKFIINLPKKNFEQLLSSIQTSTPESSFQFNYTLNEKLTEQYRDKDIEFINFSIWYSNYLLTKKY